MEKKIFRILLFVTILLTLFYISFNSSWAAEKYPERPIEIICPFSPGGSADLTTRACARGLSKVLGVTVVPVNKPGGGGVIGVTYMVNSRPDGYTISYSGEAFYMSVLLGLATYKLEDLRYIAKFIDGNHVIAVPPDSPWKTFQEFMDYVRKNPGIVTYGCPPGGVPANVIFPEIVKKARRGPGLSVVTAIQG